MPLVDVKHKSLLFGTKGSRDYFKPLKEAKDEFEKIYLIHLLDLCGGNVTRAAKLAGKYRADFYDLLKKHNLKVSDYKDSPQ